MYMYNAYMDIYMYVMWMYAYVTVMELKLHCVE